MAKRNGTVVLASGEQGEWYVAHGVLHVSYAGNFLENSVGAFGFDMEALARILLVELVEDTLQLRARSA